MKALNLQNRTCLALSPWLIQRNIHGVSQEHMVKPVPVCLQVSGLHCPFVDLHHPFVITYIIYYISSKI